MRISQKELAQLAGVSRGTVDRVLHGRPNVKPETRERIMEAIEKLHYSTNAAGRALALSGRAFPVCAVLPGTAFFDEVREGIRAAEAELSGYDLSVRVVLTDGMTEEDVVRAVDGSDAAAFMTAVNDSPAMRECVRRKTANGVPVVTFNTDLDDCGRLCFVGQDLYRSGRIAASLMLRLLGETGGRILAVIGIGGFQAQRERMRGFRDVLERSGRDVRIADVVETNDEAALTHDRVLAALRGAGRIDGVYLSTSPMDACVAALRESGRRCRVVSNDLSPAAREALKDDIIDFTIYQNPFEQGYRPVKLLFDCLVNGRRPEKTVYYTESAIITKEMID